MQTIAVRAATLAAFLCSSIAAAQPSLAPPPGPVAESGRFGTRIELTQATAPGDANSVFKIAQPGSYVLTGNLEVPPNEIGIEIASGDVTIDLNGYTIRAQTDGSGVGVGTEDGGSVPASYTGVRITGGTLASLEFGIDLVDSAFQVTTRQIAIDHLTMDGVGTGVNVEFASIRDCVISALDIGVKASFSSVSGCKLVTAGGVSTGIECFTTRISDTQIDVSFNDTGIRCGLSHVSDCSLVGLTAGTGNTGIEDQGENSIDNTYVRADTGFNVPGAGTVIRNCTWFGTVTAIAGGGTPTLIDNNF
jgi:hypothetical protein